MLSVIELEHSDIAKPKIKVYSYPETSGSNISDTSLTLIGRNYPNYGTALNENFLHLLENFASPNSPSNPIEGQLWYDTSGSRKILKVYDAQGWVTSNGVYQQSTNPINESINVEAGDIWVDTSNYSIKVYNGVGWNDLNQITGTGNQIVTWTDVNTEEDHPVILNWAEGKVVSVISSSDTFTPKKTSTGTDNFDLIKPGINLPSTGIYKLNGIAESAEGLFVNDEVISSDQFLHKDSTVFQKISAQVVFEQPNLPAQEGRDGFISRIEGTISSDYVQLFQVRPSGSINPGAGVLLNSKEGGKLVFRTKLNSTYNDLMVIDGDSVRINGDLFAPSYNASTGTVKLFAGSTLTNSIPLGWTVCNGSTATTSTFVNLFNSIGYTYGTAYSGKWFYLPNLLISTPLPAGDPRGATTATYYIIKT